MSQIFDRWLKFWFQPTNGLDLGCSRIFFFAYLLWANWSRDSSRLAEIPQELWMPIPLFSFLRLPLLSASELQWLDLVWKISLGLSCVGSLTRPATTVAFLLGLYLLGLPGNFGHAGHDVPILVITLGLLAASRCGDCLSIDSLRRRSTSGASDECRSPHGLSPEYTWPIRGVWVLIAIVFFAAGVAKLRISGLDWAFSDNMRHMLLSHHITHHPPTQWGLWVADRRWLCQGLALATIIIEVAAPLGLRGTRWRIAVFGAIFVMQLGIGLLLGVMFKSFFAVYLFVIPWSRVLPSNSTEVEPANSRLVRA